MPRAPTAAARPQARTAGFLASAAVPAQADAGPVATGASTTGASRSGVLDIRSLERRRSGIRRSGRRVSAPIPPRRDIGLQPAPPDCGWRGTTRSDYRAALALAREFYGRTMFETVPSAKRRRASCSSVPWLSQSVMVWSSRSVGDDADGAAGGLVGFAYVQAGEYFLAERIFWRRSLRWSPGRRSRGRRLAVVPH
ncbi:MAG: hypothetical protein HPM95_06455 [Alphaproteobacteria bacterium]|nr:hypothetical protein [Alphaproteobacteria bacterium]